MSSEATTTTDIYNKKFSPHDGLTAKQAKELYFLSVDDLKMLDYQRPSGWHAYMSGQGACKMYSANEVICCSRNRIVVVIQFLMC